LAKFWFWFAGASGSGLPNFWFWFWYFVLMPVLMPTRRQKPHSVAGTCSDARARLCQAGANGCLIALSSDSAHSQKQTQQQTQITNHYFPLPTFALPKHPLTLWYTFLITYYLYFR
jgi:hypothetical protein